MAYPTIRYSDHALNERESEDITSADVRSVLRMGEVTEVIEEYLDDPRGPSYLMFAMVGGRPLHVCAADQSDVDEPYTLVVTTYIVNAKKRVFGDDYKTRLVPRRAR